MNRTTQGYIDRDPNDENFLIMTSKIRKIITITICPSCFNAIQIIQGIPKSTSYRTLKIPFTVNIMV